MPTSTSQYIYTLRVCRLEMLQSGPTPEEATAIQKHVDYLARLSAEGIVLLAGRTQTTDENTFGIVIINFTSEEEAKGIMESDPAIVAGVMAGGLAPYSIAVVSPRILGD
jgi:uncharacterized protein